MTESSKFLTQTKHISLKYHNLNSYVDSKRLRIIYTCFGRSACWHSNKNSSRWSISYFTKGSKQLVNSDIHLRGSVTIHKTITFYECFGRVTIVKTIYYHILECTRILHVFWNVEFRRKKFGKTASMPLTAQLVVTNTESLFEQTSFDIYYRYCWSQSRTLAHIITVGYFNPLFLFFQIPGCREYYFWLRRLIWCHCKPLDSWVVNVWHTAWIYGW